MPCESKDIIKCKQQTAPSTLCHSLLAEFSTFLEYSWSLSFEDNPDYRYISNLFNNLSLWEGFQNAAVFDWDGANKEQHQKSAVLTSDDPGYTISWCKCEGYVLFLFWTPYVYPKLCLGCAPRCVNVRILISPLPPKFLMDLALLYLFFLMSYYAFDLGTVQQCFFLSRSHVDCILA